MRSPMDLVPQSPTPLVGSDSESDFRTPKSRPATETNTSIEQLLSMEDTGSEGAHDSEDDHVTASSASPTVSPALVTSPPYWLNHSQQTYSTGDASLESGGIMMMDNEAEDDGPRSSACWARAVEIPDYVVVNGSAMNVGAFVVFNVKVQTMNGSYMNIRKRYSEFDDFRRRLIQTFPNFEAAVPPLPPKSVISKLRPNFLEKRRAGLQYFLNCILLNPEFSGSPVLKEFLFA